MSSNNLLIVFLLLFIFSLTDAARPVLKIPHPTFHSNIPKYHPVTGERIHKVDEHKNVLYPFYKEDHLKQINSLKGMHDQPLPFRLPFFGFAYHYIWIHKDGYVAFNKGLKSYKFPVSFPFVPSDPKVEQDPSMIAIFFAHQDIPQDVEYAGVYFRIIEMDSEDELFQKRILNDFQTGMTGAQNFEPSFVMIITWNNMTFPNKRPDKPLKTNTYQMVIATNEIYTYVMFNYDWVNWITHLDNYDGLNGAPAFVGFNAGNSTRSFEYVPYSQNPRVSLLPHLGYGNDFNGRFYFLVDELVYPGACIDKELDPNLPDRLGLTTTSDYVINLGGEIINVTGPCFTPESIIFCRFDIWKVKGYYMTKNIASCVVPPVMFEGYVDMTVTVDEKTFHYTRLYLQSPESRRDFDVQIVEEDLVNFLPRKLPPDSPHKLTLKWNKDKLGWQPNLMVTLSLWGYKEKTDVYPSLTYLTDLARNIPNTGEYQLDLHQLPQVLLPRYDYQFGFIGVNSSTFKPVAHLWSRPMPLAWFMERYWIREYGQNWHYRFCTDWFNNEMEADRFATTVFRCPCTMEQSDWDRGRFAPDLQCNVIDKKCETLHHGALHCVRTARPSIGGSGQTCCYDDYGELVQTADTMYGGRPSRAFVYGKHPFKMRLMVPTLSYWVYDVMPFFYCCKWAPREDNAESCQMFNYWRTSQDCSSYQPPGIASVFGDPHFITFDRFNYTFKAKGEFVLVHVNNPVHKIDIHGRFEERTPGSNATHLTALAMRDNNSAIVEFRLRPEPARWEYHMYIFANKEMVYFWDANLRSINLKGVMLYEPAGIRNMSHVIAMFDSGAGVEILVTPTGSLKANVYLPNTYLNNTRGILGKWSRDIRDDFELPNGSPGPMPPAMTMRDIHQFMTTHYRLTETAKPHIGQSLFWHDVIPLSTYDEKKFQPKFEFDLQTNSKISPEEIERVCGTSKACAYDYLVTGDSSYAEQTRKDEAAAEILFKEMNKPVIRCPALPKPRNGRKSENRYWPGTIVRFACDEGFRLVGYEVRRCREDGLWSWGVDAECIPNLTYTLTLTGIFLGVILPVIIILLISFWCWRKERERAKGLNEENQEEKQQRLVGGDPEKSGNQIKKVAGEGSTHSITGLNKSFPSSSSVESRKDASHTGSLPVVNRSESSLV